MVISKAKIEQIQRKGYVVQLVRTKKREDSISIKIDQGSVFMFVPNALPTKEINQLLEEKEAWIIEKLAIHQLTPLAKPKEYIDGERFLYLGEQYPLAIEYGKATEVRLSLGRLLVTIPNKRDQAAQVRKALYYWYKANAEKIIRKKVAYYEDIVGVKPDDVRFKIFDSKWGSCDANRCLDFNWFIILAPENIVDYVIVHELTHLVYFSHSPSFWKEVGQVIPDYEKCEAWLRFNGQALIL